jgi:tetratricopeptide (TPR) repeat protein
MSLKALCSMAILLVLFAVSFCKELQIAKRDDMQQHLDRARALEVVNDPGAEQEFRLALETSGGRDPKVLRVFYQYLARHLRFNEAAVMVQQYLDQISDKNEDNMHELEDLRRASTLQSNINSSEKPELKDLVEYVNLVSIYGANQFRDARPYAQKAVILYPTSGESYVALAITLIGDDSTKRHELLNKAIKLNPDNAEAHYWLGLEYGSRGHWKEACVQYTEALNTSNGQLAKAWRGLGDALTMQRDYEGALEAFRNYLRIGEVRIRERKEIEQKIKELERASR